MAGQWRISQLPDEATSDIGLVLDALRAQQVDGGAIALLAIDDQFFIIIRQIGAKMQMVLSDVMAALDYEIAAEVLELSDIEFPAEDDDVSHASHDARVLLQHGVGTQPVLLHPEPRIAAAAVVDLAGTYEGHAHRAGMR